MCKHKLLMIIVLGFVACLCYGCRFSVGATIYEEVGRAQSPDSNVDAVLVTISSDTAGNNIHWLFVVPSGLKFDKDSPTFSEDSILFEGRCFDDLQLIWREDKTLEIHYKEAMIYSFRNCKNLTKELGRPHIIELRLVPQTLRSVPEACGC